MKQGHNIKDSKTKTNDTGSNFLKDDWDCLYFKEWVLKCSLYFRNISVLVMNLLEEYLQYLQ